MTLSEWLENIETKQGQKTLNTNCLKNSAMTADLKCLNFSSEQMWYEMAVWQLQPKVEQTVQQHVLYEFECSLLHAV